MYLKTIVLSLIILIISSCSSSSQENNKSNHTTPPSKKTEQKIEGITSPAGPNSSGSNLHLSNEGEIYLTWMENGNEEQNTLYYSKLDQNEWSTKAKISEGSNLLVNYADFPSISTVGSNSILAHSLVESGEYSYDINLYLSHNRGKNWTTPIIPHKDNTPTEHGFVSIVPYPDSQFLVIWLDGRKYFEDKENDIVATDKTELRSVFVNTNGEISEEAILDESTCSCCQTDAALTSNGPIVVYRDRTEGEIRDMSYVRFLNGSWSSPKTLASDNWEIRGCPVNGPAIDAKNDLVAVSWYTVDGKTSQTKVAFSTNSGESFEEPVLVSKTNTSGQVDIVLLSDGSAIASWVEMTKDASTFMCRRVKQDGTADAPFIIAKASITNPVYGFPKMVEKNDILYFAWTEGAKEKNVKTAAIKIK